MNNIRTFIEVGLALVAIFVGFRIGRATAASVAGGL